ncbi:MAG: CDP-alcohol phosphatidyltransferase [Betaproteobacteria bacterium]|nr:CDP-alcohol phosphatidyltransferase [Betaproteobacteria bacterium]
MRPFVDTALTPSHVTTLRLATGIAAAVAFAIGDRVWDITGGWLFVVSAFLDRADGELARLSGKTSTFGHRYDLAADATCSVIAFAGIGIGLSHGPLADSALLMGLISAVAIAGIFWLAQRMERAGEPLSGAAGFDPDDALFIVGPAAWFDALAPLLFAAALCAPLFLIFALWRMRKDRRNQVSR